jgi:hypothetical protein
MSAANIAMDKAAPTTTSCPRILRGEGGGPAGCTTMLQNIDTCVNIAGKETMAIHRSAQMNHGCVEFLVTISDPTHPEHASTLTWVGGHLMTLMRSIPNTVVFENPRKRWKIAFER